MIEALQISGCPAPVESRRALSLLPSDYSTVYKCHGTPRKPFKIGQSFGREKDDDQPDLLNN